MSKDSRRVKRLIRELKEEFGFSSSLTVLKACPAYKKIVKMGRAAVPGLIAELRTCPGPHATMLLRETAGASAFPSVEPGDIDALAFQWIRWAKWTGADQPA